MSDVLDYIIVAPFVVLIIAYYWMIWAQAIPIVIGTVVVMGVVYGILVVIVTVWEYLNVPEWVGLAAWVTFMVGWVLTAIGYYAIKAWGYLHHA